MEVSMLAAKLFAAVYITYGLGLLISGDYYKKAFAEVFENSGFKLIGGIMALVAGMLLVTYHNVWEGGWPVVITVFGWLALVKGVMFIVFPKHLDFWKGVVSKMNLQVLGFALLVVGLLFGYAGFEF